MPAPTVLVCGLGPGSPGRITEETRAALAEAPRGFLRTRRHPSASLATGFASFDDIYDRSDRFEDVYSTITERLVAEAIEHGEVVYAVPGSPLVLERSVRELRADDRITVVALPAVSFLDEVWSRLAVDPVDDGVRMIDGHRFAQEAAGERGPLVVAHAHAQWVLSDIKLSLDAGSEQKAILLQGLGTEAEKIVEVEWPELDRTLEADHLTSIYIPELNTPVAHELTASIEMMRRLRRECPWDRDQDHASLRRYLVEEAAEVLDALDAVVAVADGPEKDIDEAYWKLESELGDLWFQILFHAELASEAGRFTVANVATTLVEKMRHRHPHVYGDADYSADTAVTVWDELKAAERKLKGEAKPSSSLDGIAASLGALARADKILSRGSRSGVEADFGAIAVAVDRLVVDVFQAGVAQGSSHDADALGLALFGLVDAARRRGLDAETLLRSVLHRVVATFERSEAAGDVPSSWVLG